MNIENFPVEFIKKMAHSPIRNYAVPGLVSYLIGERSEGKGCVRLFHSTRNHQEPIAPHSHRFDFHCIVLAGQVRNLIWREDYNFNSHNSDTYARRILKYSGAPGHYGITNGGISKYTSSESVYTKGQSYSMEADQVHSIFFSKGAYVLFFEGAQQSDESVVLVPVVDDEVIETFRKEEWMFRAEHESA
jgi:hypothetical protein